LYLRPLPLEDRQVRRGGLPRPACSTVATIRSRMPMGNEIERGGVLRACGGGLPGMGPSSSAAHPAQVHQLVL